MRSQLLFADFVIERPQLDPLLRHRDILFLRSPSCLALSGLAYLSSGAGDGFINNYIAQWCWHTGQSSIPKIHATSVLSRVCCRLWHNVILAASTNSFLTVLYTIHIIEYLSHTMTATFSFMITPSLSSAIECNSLFVQYSFWGKMEIFSFLIEVEW